MTTVVFADLVGSTGMFERLGDETASRFVTQLVGTMSQILRRHNGRVVKLLGDGLFVVFALEHDAIAACVGLHTHLAAKVVWPGGEVPVQIQIGIESGEVVEIDGDCFGDTVNSAARLADMAGPSQTLTTHTVYEALGLGQRRALRGLGPMHLRGRAEPTLVYQVDWQDDRDDGSTMVGRSILPAESTRVLLLSFGAQTVQVDGQNKKIMIGRAAGAALVLADPRVSRAHASVEWRGGQFVLEDSSSYGTWVYFGNQQEAVVLRRTECFLAGHGQIVPSGERKDGTPTIVFSVSG